MNGQAFGYMPHGHCYFWTPEILWLHVGSDLVIAASYFSIPAALFYFVRRREDLALDWIFLLFAAFIFSCGVTHLFDVWTTWNPDYLPEGLAKGVTAAVSAVTAVVLWPLIPQALALRSPAQLEVQNLELERRVAERTADLQKSNQDLRHFASFLSHELRQPVAALLNWTAVLDDELAGASRPPARNALARLRGSAQQLRELISSELALADASLGVAPAERVDLGEVARRQVQDIADRLQAVGATVELGSLGPVFAPRFHVEQLLRNLLDNAVKYRRPSVPLVVRVASHPGTRRSDGAPMLEVEFADNGRGFEPSQAEEIFEIRRRLEPEDEPGSGIGLAICRRIVERSGGHIAASGRPGGGAVFRFALPVERPQPDEAPLA